MLTQSFISHPQATTLSHHDPVPHALLILCLGVVLRKMSRVYSPTAWGLEGKNNEGMLSGGPVDWLLCLPDTIPTLCLQYRTDAAVYPQRGRLWFFPRPWGGAWSMGEGSSNCSKLLSTNLFCSKPISFPTALTTRFSLPRGFLLFASQIHMLL